MQAKRGRNGKSPAGREGEVRIVGGTWRHRHIRFPASEQLRPTPDRLRETLFNWLGEWVVGRRVLDLYAGSGALGIEALSRGAVSALFVERDPVAAKALNVNLQHLGARAARVETADALVWLTDRHADFDLVFLDPPYKLDTGPAVLAKLADDGLLAPDHRVYLEQSRDFAKRDLPHGWTVLRSSRAGGAAGRLLRREASKTR